jgi:energy-coupling factor transporter ATP-binding protein EcfA2
MATAGAEVTGSTGPSGAGEWRDAGPGVRWRREGEDYVLAFPAAGLVLAVENLREERGELHAEWHAAADGPDGGHLHVWRASLWSTNAQQTAARYLAGAYPVVTAQLDAAGWTWQRCLETARAIVLREHRRLPEPVTLGRLDRPPRDRWLVRDLVLAGETSLLVGDRGSGKSTVAALLALAVASGRQITRYLQPVDVGAGQPVLILDWETTAWEWQERLKSLAQAVLGLPDVPDRVQYLRLDRPLAELRRPIHRLVDRLGARLVIVDSALFATGGDPKEVGPARDLLNAVAALGPEVARLVLIHIAKSDARDERGTSTSRAYGTILWEAGARVVWECRLSREADLDVHGAAATDPDDPAAALTSAVDILLTHTKINRGRLRRPFGLRVIYDADELPVDVLPLTVRESPELFDRLSLAGRVLETLRHGAMDTTEIAEELNADPDSVRQTLHRLRRRGVVVQLQGGGRGRGDGARWGLRDDVGRVG